MTANPSAAAAGQFAIGDITINRLGFGAMRVTGKGVWGQPEDPAAARETLRRLPELGVNFIDTADSYGPAVSEELLREVLHPYKGLLIATKGGLKRPGPGSWEPCGRPDYLRRCVQDSLKRLGVARIDLWQLHRIDPKVPRDDQFGIIAEMRAEGLIRHVGLSEVGIAEIEAAQKYFPVVSVQNKYNLRDRAYEAVVAFCEQHGIGFIPWFPLAAGSLAGSGSLLKRISGALKGSDTQLGAIAEKHRATPAQVALAWVLKRSKVMLPIPGTGKPDHLVQNVAAAALNLSDEDFAALDREGRKG